MRASSTVAALALGLVLAAALLGCGNGSGGSGGGALGDASPPASLDPASPRLGAAGIAFDEVELHVPAGRPFVLVFENRDSVTHNVSIYSDETLGRREFEGVLFGGPATRWYQVPALSAGEHVFACDLHPNMRGRVVAS